MAKGKGDGDDTEDESAGSKLKFIIIGAVVALGAGYFLFGGGGGDAGAEAVPPTTIPLAEEVDGAIIPVGSLTVNLSDEDPHFARISFSAVLVEGADPLAVEGKLPLLLDAALSEVANFSSDVLRSLEGQQDLRERLSARSVELLNTDEERVVKRIIFTDLLVQ